MTGSYVPFDVLVQNHKIIKSAYLERVCENGNSYREVREKLRIVRDRRKSPSVLSPTVVGILESYVDGVVMKTTSLLLSEQLTQSSEANSERGYEAPNELVCSSRIH